MYSWNTFFLSAFVFTASVKTSFGAILINDDQYEIGSKKEAQLYQAKCDPDACAQQCAPKVGRCDPLGQQCFCEQKMLFEAACDPDACTQQCLPKVGRCDPLGQKCFCEQSLMYPAACDPDACAQQCKPLIGRCDPLGQQCFCYKN